MIAMAHKPSNENFISLLLLDSYKGSRDSLMKEKNQLAQSRLNLPSPFSLMQEMSVGNVVLAFPVSSTLACCVSTRFARKRIALLAPHPSSSSECYIRRSSSQYPLGSAGEEIGSLATVFTKLTLPPIHLQETCLMITRRLHEINN